jgi:endonuclease YncB( thermonuclease family)
MGRTSPQGRRPAAPRVPLAAFLLRSRRRSRLLTAAGLIVLGLVVVLDRGGVLSQQGGDHRRYHEKWFAVARVLDGDTLDVAIRDGRYPNTRVRLWGVDCPEMHFDDQGQAHPEPRAVEATDYVRELLEGRRVRLILEPHSTRGRHGRLLAYVELEDGGVLNERLLLEGLARADRRFPHRHMQRYQTLEEQARSRRAGIWSD